MRISRPSALTSSVIIAAGGVWPPILGGAAAAITTTTSSRDNHAFDVARSSRITCQNKNEGCFLHGVFGSQSWSGFAQDADSSFVYRTGEEDSYLEVQSCYEFDCTADCDPSCSCLRIATQQVCPIVGQEDRGNSAHPSPVASISDRHMFENLQDVRLECTKSRTQCIIQGFEGCGYSVPRYNLYNDATGVFIVDDANKGDTSFELRGCNAVLGSAECDAGCTCHDLATGKPCDFTVLPPRTLPTPTATPRIVFEDLHRATLTCHAVGARCDETAVREDSKTCGLEASGESVQHIASDIQPATLRIDSVQRGTAITFSSCYSDQTFAMECDSSCICMDADTGLPCQCTNSSATDGVCHDIDHDWAVSTMIMKQVREGGTPALILPIISVIVGAVVLALLCMRCARRSMSKTKQSSKLDESPGYKEVPGGAETIFVENGSDTESTGE